MRPVAAPQKAQALQVALAAAVTATEPAASSARAPRIVARGSVHGRDELRAAARQGVAQWRLAFVEAVQSAKERRKAAVRGNGAHLRWRRGRGRRFDPQLRGSATKGKDAETVAVVTACGTATAQRRKLKLRGKKRSLVVQRCATALEAPRGLAVALCGGRRPEVREQRVGAREQCHLRLGAGRGRRLLRLRLLCGHSEKRVRLGQQR